MKAGIHPTYHDKVKVTCACGVVHEIGSTVEAYSVDVCSKCHPFYTGKQKLVDTAGRVDKFRKRAEAAEKLKAEHVERNQGKKQKETLEEKLTRKAEEKEVAKQLEKAKEEAKKKEAAKKEAEKTVVKKAKTEEASAEKPEAEEKTEE